MTRGPTPPLDRDPPAPGASTREPVPDDGPAGDERTEREPLERAVLALPDHGLSDDELPDRALLERIWRVLSRWAVPVMMSLAYILLAATSDTDAVGKTLMAAGLVIVLIVWFVFRALTETAGLARALAVGDVARLLALAERHLPRARRPDARARLLIARAFAHQLRGDPTAAIAALDEAYPASTRAPSPSDRAHGVSDSPHPAHDLAPLAHVVRLAAVIELGRSTTDLRRLPPSAPRLPALTWLAEGQLAFSDNDLDTATQRFARVIDDIRAGSATRAMAHLYAARIAEARNDLAAAKHHRTAAAAVALVDATWLRGQVPRPAHAP